VATRKRTTKTDGAKAPRKPRKKKGVADPGSRGLAANELGGDAPPKVAQLGEAIAADGGVVIGGYRDPLGGHWTLLAGLPIDKVKPTPFQRDLSDTHVKRLTDVVGQLDRFLDPIITVRTEQGEYWTPNGNHRLNAMTRLGAKSITSLVVPEIEIAYKILALNTEKAHNLREKALEVIRMARSLAELGAQPEKDFALEFEDPALLTLGLAYEERGRFSGGAYHSVLKRVDGFLDDPLPKALARRQERAARLLEVDDAVVAAVDGLKKAGFTSPYLKAFVVARVNPIRFIKGELPSFEVTMERMLKAAQKFDPKKVSTDQIAASGGAPAEE
jgi:ParB family chromosome partitioning protein